MSHLVFYICGEDYVCMFYLICFSVFMSDSRSDRGKLSETQSHLFKGSFIYHYTTRLYNEMQAVVPSRYTHKKQNKTVHYGGVRRMICSLTKEAGVWYCSRYF